MFVYKYVFINICNTLRDCARLLARAASVAINSFLRASECKRDGDGDDERRG